MQIIGAFLQFVGALVTAGGLLYVWNRITGRFDEWHRSVQAKLVDLRAQIARRSVQQTIGGHAGLDLNLTLTAEASVTRPGTVEERLHRAENEIATLAGRIKKDIEAVIDEKVAEYDAIGKGFEVTDISWALAGIAIGAAGALLSFLDSWLC